MVGQFLDIMIVASSDKEWLKQPIKIVLETVLSHLNWAQLNIKQPLTLVLIKKYFVNSCHVGCSSKVDSIAH